MPTLRVKVRMVSLMTESKKKPFFVLVAGVPRSGSTWVFNVARLLLEKSYPQVTAKWCTDYDPQDQAPAHLVKVHRPEEAEGLVADRVLTSRRDQAGCIASLVRMGWAKMTEADIWAAAERHEFMYNYWKTRSDLEVAYDRILSDPASEIIAISTVLGLTITVEQAAALAEDLARLSPPAQGRYDPVTLLHPGHRGGANGTGSMAEEVRTILARRP